MSDYLYEVEIVSVAVHLEKPTTDSLPYTVVGYDAAEKRYILNWYTSRKLAGHGMQMYKRVLPLTVKFPIRMPYQDLLP